jgi:hypothetical protein
MDDSGQRAMLENVGLTSFGVKPQKYHAWFSEHWINSDTSLSKSARIDGPA